jgi:subtilisin family serine protease/outer membrane protein OmpA-like peptidoglycan-associated protein
MDPAAWELMKDSQREEVEAIIRVAPGAALPEDVREVARFGDIVTCRLTRSNIHEVWSEDTVLSLKAPRSIGLDPDPIVEEVANTADGVRFTDVRRPEGLDATGRGVVLGAIDWGFDFAHPNFRNADGTTRAIAIWDQSAPGDGVEPYGYGRVYSREEINRALEADDPYEALGYNPGRSDPGGRGAHGTHVLDIAAGNGRASGSPMGIAPEADLVFVQLAARTGLQANLGDSVTLLEAIDWVVRVAGDSACVLNLSVGKHGGPHTGETLVEQGIEAMLTERPNRFVAQSAGNYYRANTHASRHLRPNESWTLRWNTDRADTTPNELEVWYRGIDVLGVALMPPDDADAIEVPLGGDAEIGVDGERVGHLYHRARDPGGGSNHVDVFLYPSAPAGEWRLRLTGIDVVDGRCHVWVERDSTCPGCQSQLHEDDTDALTTIGTIANGLRSVVVGAYDAQAGDDSIATFSSAGPTVDGRIKPDLVAPGVRILAARSARLGAEGATPLLTRKSGTSMASPHVAGTAALMLETAAHPLPIQAFRRLLLGSARKPTAEDIDPDRVGSGYLDIEAAIQAVRDFSHESSIEAHISHRSPLAIMTTDSAATRDYQDYARPANSPAGITDDVSHHDQEFIAMTDMLASQLDGFDDELQDQMAEEEHGCTCGRAREVLLAAPHESWHEGNGHADSQPGASVASHYDAAGPAAEDWRNADSESTFASTVQSIESASLDDLVDIAQDLAMQGREFDLFTLAGAEQMSETHPAVRAAGSGRIDVFDALRGRMGDDIENAFRAHAEVVSYPGDYPAGPLARGDVICRRSIGEGSLQHVAIIVSPELISRHEAISRGWTPERAPSGGFAHVIEGGRRRHLLDEGFARRILDDDGRSPHDQMILRLRTEEDESVVPGCRPKEVLDHFSFGSDQVLPRHQPDIIRIARCIIASFSTSSPINNLDVVGHTDPAGSAVSNLALGRRRANEVRRHLLATIDRMRPGLARRVTVNASSNGETTPIPGTAAQNRRVELFMTLPPIPAPPRPRPRPRPTPPPTDVPDDLRDLLRRAREVFERVKSFAGRFSDICQDATAPANARLLTGAERATAGRVYGTSLDFSRIAITDGIGCERRPFTIAVEVSGTWWVLMNVGTTSGISNSTLIHELAHAWQSQHHRDPQQFMWNSVQCQGLAAADQTARRLLDSTYSASAYAYVPGKPFAEYAAEQIAEQIEDEFEGSGRPTPGLSAHMRGVATSARDADNETSLSVISWENNKTSGVVMP